MTGQQAWALLIALPLVLALVFFLWLGLEGGRRDRW